MAFTGSFLPEAEAANQYLWVSAENVENGNTFYGGQVIEIIVTDPAINRLDEAYGMPDVTLDGQKVIMAQAVDGSWYAYVADATFANNIDALYGRTSDNLDGPDGADYGRFAPRSSTITYNATGDVGVTKIKITDAVGATFAYKIGESLAGTNLAGGNAGTSECNGVAGYTQGTDVLACSALETRQNHTGAGTALATGFSGVNSTDSQITNVVREARTLSNVTTTNYYGNIALSPAFWPMIQLYDFTADQIVDIDYNKGSQTEQVDLMFIDNAIGLTMDKERYGLGHEIGITIKDWNLNIDPTDEDSWTFTTNPDNASAYYQLFDENGTVDNEGKVGAIRNDGNQMSSKWGVPGILTIDRDGAEDAGQNVTNFQTNADVSSAMVCSANITSLTGHTTYNVCSIAEEPASNQAMTMVETGANTGTFVNWDDAMKTNLTISLQALRGTSSTIDYDGSPQTILHMPAFGSVEFDTSSIGSDWNSGEIVGVTIDDADMNYDARQEDALIVRSNTTVVPAIKVGSPITLANVETIHIGTEVFDTIDGVQCSSDYLAPTDYLSSNASYTSCFEKYSERAVMTLESAGITAAAGLWAYTFNSGTTVQTVNDLVSTGNGSGSYTYIQYDFRSFNDGTDVSDYAHEFCVGDTALDTIGECTTAGTGFDRSAFGTGLVGKALWCFPGSPCKLQSTALGDNLRIIDDWTAASTLSEPALAEGTSYPITLDIVTFGQSNDGVISGDRAHNSIYRVEAEEIAGDGELCCNTGLFVAEVEYIMLNQLNVNSSGTYNGTSPYSDEVVMIVHNDSTDEDEIRINYLDFGADGVETQVADQLAAPTHSGVVELDSDSYKEADTVTVTLTDADINTTPDLIDIYTVVSTTGDGAYDQVGTAGYGQNTIGDNFGRMLDITFDDATWLASAEGTACTTGGAANDGAVAGNDGLASSGFTLVETGTNTGVFTGDFQIPSNYCDHTLTKVVTTMGTDIEVNYVDYRDASGEIIEVGDGAGVRANTGSVSLDKTVYPVPFGSVDDFATEASKKTPNGRAIFPIHATGITDGVLSSTSETIGTGDLTIHIRVDDPDYDLSAAGEDFINENTTVAESSVNKHGPLKIYVSRGSAAVVLATAGGDSSQDGVITIGSSTVAGGTTTGTVQLGPVAETAPDSGVFELDMTVRYTDGPESSDCPTTTSFTGLTGTGGSTETDRFDTASSSGKNYCILQGDVLTVEYTDDNDASGNSAVAYDSATFDLRNGVVRSSLRSE
jgi:hypothetical protein